jgi:hypothetical protein
MRKSLFAVALSAALRCAAPAEETGTGKAPFDHYVTMQRELDAQRLALNELFLILLDEGVEDGAWVERDREIAREAYEPVLRPIDPYSKSLNEVERRMKAMHAPDRRAIPPVVPMRTTSSLEAWYLTRQYHLDLFFDQITALQADAAVAYAEEVWLKAANASDLTSAIPPLLDVQERGVRWPASENDRRGFEARALTYPGPHELALRCLEAFDAWSILASPDGLLPPDPESAPENTFLDWQRNWLTLRGIYHRFLERPQIDARYHQIVDRRVEAKRNAQREVINLILKTAPLPELADAVATLGRYYPSQPEQPQPAPKPLKWDAVRDYRDLLYRPGQFALEIPSDSALGRDLRIFAAYLAWRKAVEEQSGETEKLHAELLKNVDSLPPDIVTHIRQQLYMTIEKANEPPAQTGAGIAEGGKHRDDVELLMAELKIDRARQENESDAAMLDALARAIQRGAGVGPMPRDVDGGWSILARTRRGQRALALREKIASARLQELKIQGADIEEVSPLITKYRGALEKAVEAAQFDAAQAILAQSRLFSILPPEESQDWSTLLDTLRAPTANKSARRAALWSILSRSSSPALMRLAAVKLK